MNILEALAADTENKGIRLKCWKDKSRVFKRESRTYGQFGPVTRLRLFCSERPNGGGNIACLDVEMLTSNNWEVATKKPNLYDRVAELSGVDRSTVKRVCLATEAVRRFEEVENV